jgi:hypothetical protein
LSAGPSAAGFEAALFAELAFFFAADFAGSADFAAADEDCVAPRSGSDAISNVDSTKRAANGFI